MILKTDDFGNPAPTWLQEINAPSIFMWNCSFFSSDLFFLTLQEDPQSSCKSEVQYRVCVCLKIKQFNEKLWFFQTATRCQENSAFDGKLWPWTEWRRLDSSFLSHHLSHRVGLKDLQKSPELHDYKHKHTVICEFHKHFHPLNTGKECEVRRDLKTCDLFWLSLLIECYCN